MPENTEPTRGHVMINLRIDVADVAALVAAGQRSYARDVIAWQPGTATPELPHDADTVITDPAQAAVELLVEAWARCYMRYTNDNPPLIESLGAVAEWGDVDNKQFYPAGDKGGATSTGKQLADIIRDVYGEDEPTVARFTAVEYDNGWFFTDYPEIVLANDDIDHYEGDGDGDISQQVVDLSVEHGPIGAQAQMTVDLFTGHVEVDIYGGLF